MKITSLVILWVLCFSPCLASADQLKDAAALGDYSNLPKSEASATPTSVDAKIAADQMAHQFQMLREEHKVKEVIALCILAFVSLVTVLYFLAKRDDQPGLHIVYATGLIFITFGTILLVIMAETDEQLTAAIGILGGIAGYLFGSMRSKDTGSGKGAAAEYRNPKEG